MKNRMLERVLLIVAWIVIIINLTVDLVQGISKAEIFNYSCSLILILLWNVSFVMRKRGW